MKQYILIFAAMLPLTLHAQDVITERNGQTIRGKVLAVTPREVSYKLDGNSDGATIVIPKNDVLSISYADGSSMNFAAPGNIEPISEPKGITTMNADIVNSYKRGDKVLYKNEKGKFRTGVIVGLKPNFAIVKASGGTREMPYSQIAKFEEK